MTQILSNFIFSNPTLIVILILLGFALVGLVRGFFSQLIGFVGSIVAIILAALLAKNVAHLLEDTVGLITTLKGSVASAIHDLGGEASTLQDAQLALEAATLPSFLKESILSYLVGLNSQTVNLSEAISLIIAEYLATFIGFIVVFIVVKIVFFLFRWLFKILTKLPILNIINRLLGAVLGLIKGLLLVYIIIFIIDIIPYEAIPELKDNLAASSFITFLSEHNLFSWLFSLIKI